MWLVEVNIRKSNRISVLRSMEYDDYRNDFCPNDFPLVCVLGISKKLLRNIIMVLLCVCVCVW